jgi:hypothetical protein
MGLSDVRYSSTESGPDITRRCKMREFPPFDQLRYPVRIAAMQVACCEAFAMTVIADVNREGFVRKHMHVPRPNHPSWF